jgi:hypothetical protein
VPPSQFPTNPEHWAAPLRVDFVVVDMIVDGFDMLWSWDNGVDVDEKVGHSCTEKEVEVWNVVETSREKVSLYNGTARSVLYATGTLPHQNFHSHGKLKSGKFNQSVHMSGLPSSHGKSSIPAENKSEFVTVSLTSL